MYKRQNKEDEKAQSSELKKVHQSLELHWKEAKSRDKIADEVGAEVEYRSVPPAALTTEGEQKVPLQRLFLLAQVHNSCHPHSLQSPLLSPPPVCIMRGGREGREIEEEEEGRGDLSEE